MVTLAFDTCFDACSASVAEVRAGGVDVRASAFEQFETGHAERLVPMIAEVMAKAGVGFDDLKRIAVTAGPGTFTGTRIGIAAARGFALATGCEVVCTSSLSVMARVAAEQLAGKITEGELAVAVDARREEVYVQCFSADGVQQTSPPLLCSIDEAAKIGSGDAIAFVGSGAVAVTDAACIAGRRAAAYLPGLLPNSDVLARMAGALSPIEGQALVPLYLRPPDAKPQAAKTVARVQ